MHPAVESPRNADVALQVAFTLANLANGHTQRQAFVLAHGQLLCSLLSALALRRVGRGHRGRMRRGGAPHS